MTSTIQNPPKLIHVAKIYVTGGNWRHLLLRKVESNRFVWFEYSGTDELETGVSAQNIEEAIRVATRHWKRDDFTCLNCGFRYTLPERDEHGLNAYFMQMAASYSSMNGIYYDEELGNNCFVQSASIESYELWQLLKAQKRV